jgi:hypothetical protein
VHKISRLFFKWRNIFFQENIYHQDNEKQLAKSNYAIMSQTSESLYLLVNYDKISHIYSCLLDLDQLFIESALKQPGAWKMLWNLQAGVGVTGCFMLVLQKKKTGNTETTYLYINHLLCIHIQPTSANYNCTKDDHEIGELFQCNVKFN